MKVNYTNLVYEDIETYKNIKQTVVQCDGPFTGDKYN